MVINWISASNVGWQHMNGISHDTEVRPCHKCNVLHSWCTVLLKDKLIFSNAADRWQQFPHQQYFSVIGLLPVDFSARFNE